MSEGGLDRDFATASVGTMPEEPTAQAVNARINVRLDVTISSLVLAPPEG